MGKKRKQKRNFSWAGPPMCRRKLAPLGTSSQEADSFGPMGAVGRETESLYYQDDRNGQTGCEKGAGFCLMVRLLRSRWAEPRTCLFAVASERRVTQIEPTYTVNPRVALAAKWLLRAR